MNIGMIGLGKLGFPVALAIDSKGHNVIGYDVNPKISSLSTHQGQASTKGSKATPLKTQRKDYGLIYVDGFSEDVRYEE